MRWVRDFHPVDWLRVSADNKEDLKGEIRYQMPNEVQPTRIVSRVIAGANAPVSPPEAMLPELRVRMTAYMTNDLKARVIEAGER